MCDLGILERCSCRPHHCNVQSAIRKETKFVLLNLALYYCAVEWWRKFGFLGAGDLPFCECSQWARFHWRTVCACCWWACSGCCCTCPCCFNNQWGWLHREARRGRAWYPCFRGSTHQLRQFCVHAGWYPSLPATHSEWKPFLELITLFNQFVGNSQKWVVFMLWNLQLGNAARCEWFMPCWLPTEDEQIDKQRVIWWREAVYVHFSNFPPSSSAQCTRLYVRHYNFFMSLVSVIWPHFSSLVLK